MTYVLSFFLISMVLGLVGVASNPAPYYAALGLVAAAAAGCGVLVGHGGSFLSLVLLLIYLGGMLVVFAYSAALAAEPYPEAWGDQSVLAYIGVYGGALGLLVTQYSAWWYEGSWAIAENVKEFGVMQGDSAGVALIFSEGGQMLVACGLALLLTLFVVLELTRGGSRGAVRAV